MPYLFGDDIQVAEKEQLLIFKINDIGAHMMIIPDFIYPTQKKMKNVVKNILAVSHNLYIVLCHNII